MKTGGKIGRRLDRWLDECKMALSGVVLATREWRFLVAFGLTFVIFGTLMNLLSGSGAALDLFWKVNFGGKLQILADGFWANFGVGKNFWDWLLTFGLTVLQSILIGLVVLVWQKRRRGRRVAKAETAAVAKAGTKAETAAVAKAGTKAETAAAKTETAAVVAAAKNANNVSDAGLAAGLAILGSGCPTCGTTLLAPMLGTLFSSGGYMLAGILSGVLTVAALLLALFALKRIGKDAYVMITAERYQKRHAQDNQAAAKRLAEEANGD